jgi:hypothetical protein
MGSFMPKSIKLMVVYGCFTAAFAVTAACSPRHHQAQPMSVSDLMEDRVTLDGVLMKCNRNVASHTDPDCLNARIAIERLDAQNEDKPAREAKRQEDFERSREQLRALQDNQGGCVPPARHAGRTAARAEGSSVAHRGTNDSLRLRRRLEPEHSTVILIG